MKIKWDSTCTAKQMQTGVSKKQLAQLAPIRIKASPTIQVYVLDSAWFAKSEKKFPKFPTCAQKHPLHYFNLFPTYKLKYFKHWTRHTLSNASSK